MKGDFDMKHTVIARRPATWQARLVLFLCALCACAILLLMVSGPFDLFVLRAAAEMYNYYATTNISAGDVVVWDTTVAYGVKTTTSASSQDVAGIAEEDIAAGNEGFILLTDGRALLNVTGSVAKGNYVYTSATQGSASGSATLSDGAFGRAITASGTPAAGQCYIQLNLGLQDGAGDGLSSGDLDTEAKLEAQLSDVSNVITNNDDSDDVAEGSTNLYMTSTQETNFEAAYSHSQGDGSDHEDVASNTALAHTQGTDQGLDTGGANAVTAAQAKAGYTHSGVSSGNPHSVTKSDVGLGNVQNIKVKLDATAAPTVNDDVDEGYSVDSRWVDVTNDKEYVCLDATDGAAVWTETTGIGATQMSELTDVGDATPTDGNALMGDGDSWESRALTKSDVGLSNVDNIQSNYSAVVDPTVDDDENDDYEVGSLWFNIATQRVFTCTDASAGAAVWRILANRSVVDFFTNGSGVNHTAGTVVTFSSSNATFDDAWALGATNFLGVLLEDIDAAASGRVILNGIATIHGIYNAGFSVGDYVAFGASGTGWTATRDDTCFGKISNVIDADSAEVVLTHPIHTGGAAGGGAGEVNTASNQGGGIELFLEKSTFDLEFATLVALHKAIGIYTNGDTVEFNFHPGAVVHNSLQGLTDGDPHTQYRLESEPRGFSFSFDPGAQYDSSAKMALFKIGADAPNGMLFSSWECGCGLDPDVEIDMDIMYADDRAGTGATVIDALDTTAGASSESTAANINGGNPVANGKYVYINQGADSEGTCVNFSCDFYWTDPGS